MSHSGVKANTRRAIFERDAGRCHYCPAVTTFEDGTVDHVWPHALGGRNAQRNLVWACVDCNGRLDDRTDKCDCAFCRDACAWRDGNGHWTSGDPTPLDTALGALLAWQCVTCGADAEVTFWGPVALGVCRDPANPNDDDEGQHVVTLGAVA